MAIDADGDDSYTLACRRTASTFTPLWTRRPPGRSGHAAARRCASCTAPGRYLRLAASGGDGVYAVAELSVAADCPPRWPPVLAPLHGTPIERSAATKAWAFAALAAAYVLAYRRKLPDFIKLLVAAPLGVALALAFQLAEIWPPPRSLLGAAARRARDRRRRVRAQGCGVLARRQYQIYPNVISNRQVVVELAPW